MLLPGGVLAEQMRIALFAAPLKRAGPGLLLRDLMRDDAQIDATIAHIAAVAPDVLVLTAFDYDAGAVALATFRDRLGEVGLAYPHLFSRLPNTGMTTGLDMNGDGRTGGPRDAQGYGRFAGHAGMAVLSRWPVDEDAFRDFSSLLWRDLPGATLPEVGGQPFPSPQAQAVQRLSSTAHWQVPVLGPGGRFDLLIWSATPPVFDGPEDMNGLRNRDELRLWTRLLDGDLGDRPGSHFIIAGNANLDPFDSDGLRGAMADFLADPRLQDPTPESAGGRAAAVPGQTGPPERATAQWDGPGNLRVSYVLPSAAWQVVSSGVFWPAPDEHLGDLMGEDGLAAGPHRLVWVDLRRGE